MPDFCFFLVRIAFRGLKDDEIIEECFNYEDSEDAFDEDDSIADPDFDPQNDEDRNSTSYLESQTVGELNGSDIESIEDSENEDTIAEATPLYLRQLRNQDHQDAPRVKENLTYCGSRKTLT